MSVHICPPDHAHADTATCYTSHACRCIPCREASTEYSYWRHHMIAAGRVDLLDLIVDATGARRRLQALQALGHSGVVLAHHLSVDKSMVPRWSLAETMRQSTVDRIAELYEQLSATKPNPTTPAERVSVTKTLRHAARQGWMPPLAWDDIDTDAHPVTIVTIHRREVDPVAITLATQGLDAILTDAERRIVAEALIRDGRPDAHICRVTGYSDRQILRIRNKITQQAAA